NGMPNEKINARKRSIEEEIQVDSMEQIGNYLTTDSTISFVHKTFDAQTADSVYFGNGAFQGTMQDWNVVFSDSLKNIVGNPTMRMAIWIYLHADRRARTTMYCRELDANGNLINQRVQQARQLVKVIDNNGWAMLEWDFQLSDPKNKIEIVFQNPELKKEILYLDELLIYPNTESVYLKRANYLWKNNRHFKK
ncbi:MAG: hypothetical protein AAFO07_24305, partial [Bacteroidota bacterium]